jgi:hypothetical protein
LIARRVYPLLWLGFTLIALGYLVVWLPQPVVGLSLIGLEMGEWVKFLPEVQAGTLPDRNLFYLPPVLLGMMMAVWTAAWPNGRWQTWAMRGLAVGVSLLAFPSSEAIRFEPSGEWLLRVGLVGLVGATAVLSALLDRLPVKATPFLLLLLALLSLIVPTWAYFSMRPVIADLFQTAVSIGPGLLLHLLGNVLVIVAAGLVLLRRPNNEGTQSNS